ncbi:helix-turn-helix transcriptional regulator [Kitasatospora sp. NPDC101801]|uniref:helix-turn-helix transcriptional regulator n=1 Tax=Kitasatospora sp. NPDC101801 TaxID=3364103 RepID=UPI00382A2531
MPETPLGAFLRARRRLAPVQAGSAGSRRRTPGLRREEVAVRAGISADYYARLEQGRQRVPTGPVLDGLAEALMLAAPERAYLHRLAHRQRPPTPAEPEPSGVPAATLALLGTLTEVPAFVTGPRFDLLACNPRADALLATPMARPAHERNLLWQVFCCPYAAAAPDNLAPDGWIGADLVAGLRAHHADRPADRPLAALVGQLERWSPAFAALWAQHRAGPPRRGRLSVPAPAEDPGTFEYTVLTLPEADQHLFMLVGPGRS